MGWFRAIWSLARRVEALVGILALVVWVVTTIGTLPAYAIVLGSIFALCAPPIAYACYCEFIAPLIKQKPPNIETETLADLRVQKRLTDCLMQYANEHADADIAYASATEYRLSERIAPCFEAAGWTVNYNSYPQEQWRHVPMMGVKVRGWNKHRIEAIANALIDSGVLSVYTQIEEIPFSNENPKYQRTLNRVLIEVGHTEN